MTVRLLWPGSDRHRRQVYISYLIVSGWRRDKYWRVVISVWGAGGLTTGGVVKSKTHLLFFFFFYTPSALIGTTFTEVFMCTHHIHTNTHWPSASAAKKGLLLHTHTHTPVRVNLCWKPVSQLNCVILGRDVRKHRPVKPCGLPLKKDFSRPDVTVDFCQNILISCLDFFFFC